jgi:hypothetical protein
MALFKLIKELELRLSDLESKKPSTLLFKMIIDAQIKGLQSKIKELRDEVAERKKGKYVTEDYK